MPHGVIHQILAARGQGFIRQPTGEAHLPFDRSSMEGTSFEQLQSGQKVWFETIPDPAHPGHRQAVKVRLVSE